MKTYMHPLHPRILSSEAESGFSLIEVLVALLVLSIGLLGLAMLQVQGMRFTADSYQRSQATILAYDLMDRMRANKVGADAGAYCLTVPAPAATCTTTAPPSAVTCATSGGCTTKEDLAKYDLTQWYQLQQSHLNVNATAYSSLSRTQVVMPSGNSVWQYTITMRWFDRDLPVSQNWVVEL
jgi:type IV pilus assembly protein PilV